MKQVETFLREFHELARIGAISVNCPVRAQLPTEALHE